ncbi:hypothetical protein DSLASN_24330 [Desulfoluna limicola]|uniref:Uncharacterized protein n=1 Tax=Desulfoluna limicola TaxID=2810562 RepID=A0ABM7PHQ2_9BACT|nr:hypothetical protein DSLASN_24330 [Desulfoluna limicola]
MKKNPHGPVLSLLLLRTLYLRREPAFSQRDSQPLALYRYRLGFDLMCGDELRFGFGLTCEYELSL